MSSRECPEGPSVRRRVSALARAARVPIRVKVDLTYACNLRCVHCCVSVQPRTELDHDEVRALLADLAAKGCLYLSLSGGEIFLREDLRDILEEAHRLKFCLGLMTNGTLIPAEMIPHFGRLNVGEVAVSLYGDDATLHDAVTRVPGSFERTVENVRRLRSAGVRVKIALMILRQNFSRFRQMAALAERLGAAWNLDPVLLPKFDGSKEPLALRIPASDLMQIAEYREARAQDIKRMNDEWDPDRWLEEPPCGAGATACSISPYGEVFPCSVMPLVAGNVRERSFAEIWDRSEVLERLRAIRRRDLKPCSTCGQARFCFVCMGLALAEDGDLLGPSTYHCAEASVHRAVYEKTYAENRPCITVRR